MFAVTDLSPQTCETFHVALEIEGLGGQADLRQISRVDPCKIGPLYASTFSNGHTSQPKMRLTIQKPRDSPEPVTQINQHINASSAMLSQRNVWDPTVRLTLCDLAIRVCGRAPEIPRNRHSGHFCYGQNPEKDSREVYEVL